MRVLSALADDALDLVLMTATLDIDNAMRFQGRKYDPDQEREFPRVPRGQTPNQFGSAISDPIPYPSPLGRIEVWDWDPANDVPIVPQKVLIAVLFQAAWLMQPQYAQRLEDIRSGLAAQAIRTSHEMNIKSGEAAAGGFSGLGDRAQRIMDFYRLKTGRSH